MIRGRTGSAGLPTSAVNIFALGAGLPTPPGSDRDCRGTRWGRPAVARFGGVGRPAPSPVKLDLGPLPLGESDEPHALSRTTANRTYRLVGRLSEVIRTNDLHTDDFKGDLNGCARFVHYAVTVGCDQLAEVRAVGSMWLASAGTPQSGGSWFSSSPDRIRCACSPSRFLGV